MLSLTSSWPFGVPETRSATRSRPISTDPSQVLARRASSGDRSALESLLREHARAVHDLCRIIAGPEDGRDAAQESLEKIVLAIRSYDASKGSFKSWALTVARNTCRDRLRRRGLERRLFEDPGEPGMVDPVSEAPDAERLTFARIESQRLLAALEHLPEPMRLAILLFHVHDATYDEIAKTLEVPIGTVMTWLHRGRKRLRDALLAESGELGGAA